MKNIKKYIALFSTLLMTAGALSGCSLFGDGAIRKADYSGMVTLASVEETMTIINRPKIVDELEEPDKTLYNPLFFISTNNLGAVKVLDENKYFSYDLLDSADYDKLDEITEPTNISVVFYSNASHSDWRVRFSCFIYKIEDDYMYLGTAGHCISQLNCAPYAEITFFNRERVYTSMAEYKLGGNFGSNDGDYAMYRIKTADIPYDLLLKLKSATYDKTAISNVKPGDVIYSGNIYCQHQEEDYDMKMTVMESGSETFQYYAAYFGYFNSGNYFITSGHLVSGQSGSAIFDKYGNVIGVCSGMANGSGHENVGIMTAIYKMDELYNAFIEDDIEKERRM